MNPQQKNRGAAGQAASSHGTSRGHGSREDELSSNRASHVANPVPPWVRPSSLDAPPPRDGMVQRWIRHLVGGASDPRNVSKRTREGWRPRPANTVPEEFRLSMGAVEADTGIIVVDDLILCEMPAETYAQRAAYYDQLTQAQMAGVMQELDSIEVGNHRIHRSLKSEVSLPGRRVEVADNE